MNTNFRLNNFRQKCSVLESWNCPMKSFSPLSARNQKSSTNINALANLTYERTSTYSQINTLNIFVVVCKWDKLNFNYLNCEIKYKRNVAASSGGWRIQRLNLPTVKSFCCTNFSLRKWVSPSLVSATNNSKLIQVSSWKFVLTFFVCYRLL